MSWRRAGTYFLMFLVLAGYYAATELRSDTEGAALPPRHAFLPFGSADVTAVTVQRGATRVHAALDGSRWRVDEPPGVRVPTDLIAALVEQLTTLPDVETVAENGEGAAQFGLEPPESLVTFDLRDGRHATVVLGGRNPAQTAAYGRIEGEARIVLLGLNLLYYRDLILQAAGSVE